jgi:lysophospholipase L1-like esterase
MARRVVPASLVVAGLVVAAAYGLAPAGVGPAEAQRPVPRDAQGWVGTWATSPSGTVTARGYPRHTFRQVVHVSLGGNRVRVRFSNAFSAAPVQLTATVALPAAPGSAAARPGTVRRLTFDGRPLAVLPPRGELLSDPATLTVPADGDLFVTTYTPRPSGPVTYHGNAYQTSFFATGADHSADVSDFAFRRRTTSWFYVTGVDVDAADGARAIVALGDSITDGVASGRDRNARWPDVLADRLTGEPTAVVNAGIGGNRLLNHSPIAGPSALSRLNRDVFSVPGVRTLLVLEGVNDLKQRPRADNARQLIDGLEEVARQARARGIRVICATITPYRGWPHWDPLGERIRQEVNAFIRTGDAFDAVVDFDAVVRDPSDPARLAPAYDSGDHLHPNAAGLSAMADAIDLDVL